MTCKGAEFLVAFAYHLLPESVILLKRRTQRLAGVGPDKPQPVRPRQAGLEARKIETGDILDPPALRQRPSSPDTVEIDQIEPGRFFIRYLPVDAAFEEQVAQVKISVIQAGRVEAPCDAGHLRDQRALEHR